MTSRCSLLLLASFAMSCANAGGGASLGGDDGNGDDGPPVDARPDTISSDAVPPIDSPSGPTTATLTQTTSATPTAGNSLVCRITANSTTPENGWYRIFRLADLGVTGPFNVTSVSFGVALAEGAPTATIKIGTYAPSVATPPTTLDTAQITPITSATYVAPDVPTNLPITATVDISAVVPANAQLIVEITAPDYSNTKKFWIAGNPDGESKTSWWRAPTCSRPQPVTPATAGFATTYIPITVTGTHTP